MDYVIKNRKNLYIRLNENGLPVTCSETNKGLFEYSKAKNIVDNLKKNLKKLNFRVEAVPDTILIQKSERDRDKNASITFIKNEDYNIPDNVIHWINKFGICSDIVKEAELKEKELYIELSNVDKAFSNIIHEIEFKKSIDLYGAWLVWKKIKNNRKKRRDIKDEIYVIQKFVKMDFRKLDEKTINKTMTELANRKFKFRVVEDGEDYESL